ncbi:MAG: multidrug efflux SMR transporter [Parafilimonas sp.]|nr:multidrug efflux SMR transporter [Parafilimonas sp.]
MGYIFLTITVVAESVAIIFMKLSNGFQQKLYAVIAVILYSASFIFLTLALKQLHAGTANAMWAGASTVLVAIAGIYIFNEKFNWMQMISIAFIIAGLIGLNIQKLKCVYLTTFLLSR